MKAEDRRKLIERVQMLDGITDDERAALLGLLRESKTYGLVWEDKPEDVEDRLREELPVLVERNDDKVHSIISDNPDAPNHIIIEGDNLEALSTLAYTHAGKIDVIYIDPPYNTGNKDFIYNDSYVDSEDSYRHSKWLSFMSKRLRIAKKLLSNRGVIFISIDDNELCNLKLLSDEVFNNCYIGCLPRITKRSGKAHSSDIARNHDYVLIYSKFPEISFRGIPSDAKGFDNSDEYVSTRGKYKLNQTLDYDSLWYNPAMDFPLEVDGVTYYAGGSESAHIARHSGSHNPKDWVWRWSKAKFDFGLKHGFVVFKKGRNGVRIYTKTYLNASIEKDITGNYIIAYKDRETKISSLALVENEFSNDNAKKELSDYMDANSFDFPKPTSLIKQLAYLTENENPIILDFFAGSGTTLHAVMQLNAEDGGKRTCILCTNNENGICENVTYERNKRVINGYTKPNGEDVEGLHDNNLRYYRTAFVGRSRSVQNMRRLVNLSTDMLCIKEDLYTEKKQFAGQQTYKGVFRFFDDGKKQMLVIYREEAIAELVPLIASTDYAEPIKVYVFSPSEDPWEAEFEEVADKVQLCALPQAIYNTYKRILPKPKDRNIAAEEQPAEPTQDSPGGLFDFAEEGGEA
jgi:adenine-specific DNA-methyltransferase